MGYSTDLAIQKYNNLIKWWAKKYYVNGYETEDLEQQFSLVMLRCCKTFDKTKGSKFNTYLTTAVHRELTNLLKKKSVEEEELTEDFVDNREFYNVVVPTNLSCGERVIVDLLLCGYRFKEIKQFGISNKYLKSMKRKWLGGR